MYGEVIVETGFTWSVDGVPGPMNWLANQAARPSPPTGSPSPVECLDQSEFQVPLLSGSLSEGGPAEWWESKAQAQAIVPAPNTNAPLWAR